MSSLKPGFALRRLPNDLALDAAGIAVVWRLALAHGLGLTVSAGSQWVLGLSVWLVYLGDRWLDVRRKAPSQLPTQRHWLAARWRWPLLGLWLVVLIVDVWLAWQTLTAAQFNAGLLVLGLSVAYTVGIQRRARVRRTKELQVALIFAVGVGAFFVGETLGGAAWFWLVLKLMLFGMACFANCVLLARWEMDADVALGRQSLPLAMPDRAAKLRHYALATCIFGLLVFVFATPILSHSAIALAIYGLSLLAIDKFEWPRDPEDRRCVADGWLLVVGLLAWLA
ncbi:hypothetical protein [Cerasicoccus maritimus]|uniref:hypothetical protein n=1 Tax=Cerasicoccus maritimus TaxID=490089 RepID=UPI0028529454|nr:hypothetical protein [Cerasicoccus maritimus]